MKATAKWEVVNEDGSEFCTASVTWANLDKEQVNFLELFGTEAVSKLTQLGTEKIKAAGTGKNK